MVKVLAAPARPADAIAGPPHPHRVASPKHALADPHHLLLVPTVAFLCSFTFSSKTFEPVDDVDEEDTTCS